MQSGVNRGTSSAAEKKRRGATRDAPLNCSVETLRGRHVPHPRTYAWPFSIAIADGEQLPNVIGAADRHDRQFVRRSSSFKRTTKVLHKEQVKVTVLNRTTLPRIAVRTCAVLCLPMLSSMCGVCSNQSLAMLHVLRRDTGCSPRVRLVNSYVASERADLAVGGHCRHANHGTEFSASPQCSRRRLVGS
jgi:hypothetical protein